MAKDVRCCKQTSPWSILHYVVNFIKHLSCIKALVFYQIKSMLNIHLLHLMQQEKELFHFVHFIFLLACIYHRISLQWRSTEWHLKFVCDDIKTCNSYRYFFIIDTLLSFHVHNSLLSCKDSAILQRIPDLS